MDEDIGAFVDFINIIVGKLKPGWHGYHMNNNSVNQY